MRSNTTQRSYWVQFSVGACALVLPPLTLGAAFYSMLASPDEGAARPTPPISADPQPAVQAARSIAVAGKPALPEDRSSVSITGVRQEPIGRSAQDPAKEETARVSDSVPLQVAVAPPARVNPPLRGDVDGAPSATSDADLSQSAPAEVSTALLPRVLFPPGQARPQIAPARKPIAEGPSAQAPLAADGPPTGGPQTASLTGPKHGANLVGHGGVRAGARNETPAARRNTHPQPQEAFSLKNWLQQQLGIRPHNTRG
jgi:hypothetical protein